MDNINVLEKNFKENQTSQNLIKYLLAFPYYQRFEIFWDMYSEGEIKDEKVIYDVAKIVYGVAPDNVEAFREIFDFVDGCFSDSDLITYKHLKNNIKLYRATTEDEIESGEIGISWTRRKSVAKKFQHEYYNDSEERNIYSITVPKNRIKAIIDEMDEFEVILTDVEPDEIELEEI